MTSAVMRSGAPWLARVLKPELAILIGLFLVLYFFKLASFTLLIDDEVAAVRVSPEIWLTQGRWGAYLFERWLLPNPVIPFVATFVFGFFSSVGYLILLDAHGVRRPGLVHYAAFPLFVAFPTWLYLAAFAANIGAAGLGLLFCCLAALGYSRFVGRVQLGEARQTWIPLVVVALMSALAMGIYQTYVFVVVVLSLGVLLGVSLRGPVPCRKLIADASVLLIALLLGIALYKLIDVLFLKLLGVQASGYVGQFANIRLLLDNPIAMIDVAWDALRRTYGGDAAYYGIEMPGFPLLMVLGVLALAVSSPRIALPQRLCNVLLGIVLLGTPFVMHLLSGGMPLRTMVAVPSVVWLFAVIGLTCGHRWLESMTSIALLVSVFGILHIVNGMQAVDSYVRAHDRHLAADLYRRIAESNPGFDVRKPQVVDIHGGKPFESAFPRTWSSTWGYSFFEWDGGNPQHRILPYMRLLGYSNLVLAPPESRQVNLRHFAAMPSWPAVGSVRVVDGVTLIKLGEAPGHPFNLP